jgi:hypothetical protein
MEGNLPPFDTSFKLNEMPMSALGQRHSFHANRRVKYSYGY